MARSRLSMAITTPAQKPRGVARMIFTAQILRKTTVILPLALHRTNRSRRKRTTPPVGVALRIIRDRRVDLFEFDFGDLDRHLVAVFADDAGDFAFLGFGADLAVILLVAIGVEPIHNFLVAFFDLDHG